MADEKTSDAPPSESVEWDHREAFKEHVAPLLDALFKKCTEHRIPIVAFAQFCLLNDLGAGQSQTRHIPSSIPDAGIYRQMKIMSFTMAALEQEELGRISVAVVMPSVKPPASKDAN